MASFKFTYTIVVGSVGTSGGMEITVRPRLSEELHAH